MGITASAKAVVYIWFEDHIQRKVNVYIFSTLTVPFILGLDFMAKYKIVMMDDKGICSLFTDIDKSS